MFGATVSYAQSISQTVIGNQGAYYESTSLETLTFTIGELSTSYHENSSASLGRGFHHVAFSLIVKTYTPFQDWEINAYPNPTVDQLTVEVPAGEAFNATLFSAVGQQMATWQLNDTRAELDLQSYPAGAYFLRITDEQGQIMTIQVHKL